MKKLIRKIRLLSNTVCWVIGFCFWGIVGSLDRERFQVFELLPYIKVLTIMFVLCLVLYRLSGRMLQEY